MGRKALSVAEAKASLSDAIREVERGGTVLITRHGKPVAALVKAEDLEKLERLRAAGPQQGLASVMGGWEGSQDLVANIAAVARRGRRRAARLEQDLPCRTSSILTRSPSCFGPSPSRST